MALEDIVIPQVGEAVDEVTLIEWLKTVGDSISEGDVLFEVDTEKAIVEIPAFADGTLAEIICGDNSLVMPLQVVGKLETAKASSDSVGQDNPPAEPVLDQRPPHPEDFAASRSSLAPSGKTAASPRARQLARSMSVDITTITGSGRGGMITESDVQGVAPSGTDGDDKSREIREAVARRTAIAKSTVPHFYLEMDVDFSTVEERREATPPGYRPPTITAVIIDACAQALSLVPDVNVSFHDGELERRSTVAVGVSVASERGLINVTLPNLRGTNISEISARLAEAIARARAFQLRPDDLGPKSLVVSNLGMYGVDAFTAIIDVPDPMILAVGRVVRRPVVSDDVVVIRPMARLTLSVDHRAIDGEGAAAFLGHVRRILEGGNDV